MQKRERKTMIIINLIQEVYKVKIKDFFKRRKNPAYRYIFLCRQCDILFDRIGFYNKCPVCGRPAEVYASELIKDNE